MKKLSILLISFLALLIVFYVATPSDKLFELGISAERSIAGLSTNSVNISQGNVVYWEGGEGETLLLLHGFGANKDNWNRIAPHLTSHYRLIAIDLPGFGESIRNHSVDYTINNQVSWLSEIIEQLGIQQFHIAGNSMGGYIAGNYAAINPDKVLSLWLINALGVASAPASEMFNNIAQKQRPVVLASTTDEYHQLMDFVFHNPPYIPELFIEILAQQAKTDFLLHAKIFEDIHNSEDFVVDFSSPLEQALANFDKPVLVTWGDKDRVLHPEGAFELGQSIPLSQVNVMENVGHLPMIESPKLTADQFTAFAQNKPNN